MIGRTLVVTGRVVVVARGLDTTCPKELDAPTRETEAALNSTAEEKRGGSFIDLLTRCLFMAEVQAGDKRFLERNLCQKPRLL